MVRDIQPVTDGAIARALAPIEEYAEEGINGFVPRYVSDWCNREDVSALREVFYRCSTVLRTSGNLPPISEYSFNAADLETRLNITSLASEGKSEVSVAETTAAYHKFLRRWWEDLQRKNPKYIEFMDRLIEDPEACPLRERREVTPIGILTYRAMEIELERRDVSFATIDPHMN